MKSSFKTIQNYFEPLLEEGGRRAGIEAVRRMPAKTSVDSSIKARGSIGRGRDGKKLKEEQSELSTMRTATKTAKTGGKPVRTAVANKGVARASG